MMDSTSINRLQRRKLWKRPGANKPGRGLGRGVRTWGLGLIAALCFLAAGQKSRSGLPALTLRAAHAQDFALAGQHFSSAQDAFAQGKYEQAAKEFQAAFDITHDSSMLVNIGESWQRAGDGKKALAGYRAYLAAQPQAPDRSEIEGRIQALETALAEAAAPSAGQPGTSAATKPAAGTTPGPATNTTTPATPASPATPANPPSGVEKPATAPPVAGQAGPAPTVPPAAGPDSGLGKPTLPAPVEPGKPAAAKPDASSKPAAPAGPMTGLRTAAWVSVAVAVALATSGAIVGLGAQDRADELGRRTTVLVGTQPPVYDAGQADAYTTLQSEGKAYNQASIALLSVAGAVAVTAGILFIVDYVRRPRAETRSKGGWALVPTLLPGSTGSQLPAATGLVAVGRF